MKINLFYLWIKMGNITNGQIPKNKDLKYCGANVSKKLFEDA